MTSSCNFNILILNQKELNIERLDQALPYPEYRCVFQSAFPSLESLSDYDNYDMIIVVDYKIEEAYLALIKALKMSMGLDHLPLVIYDPQSEKPDYELCFKKGFSEILNAEMSLEEIRSRIRRRISEGAYSKFMKNQLEDSRKNMQESDSENKWMSDRYFLFERIKNNYFQIISHELRTPLNIIFIITDILPKMMDAKNGHYIYKLKTALNQINDLIDISNLSELLMTKKNSTKLTPVSFSEIYSNLCVRFENEIKTGLLEFTDQHQEDLCIDMDYDMIYKALVFTITHLYINASKQVKIAFNTMQTPQGKVLEIINYSDRFKPNAAQFFHRVISFRTIDNQNEGLKLGIRLLKYTMDYHYGKLELSNIRNSGSVYKLIFKQNI